MQVNGRSIFFDDCISRFLRSVLNAIFPNLRLEFFRMKNMQKSVVSHFTHRVSVIIVLMLVSLASVADEGMWLISQIEKNMVSMQRLGLKLTAEDIYSINANSLNDAVVQLDDGGCSAELISPFGLVLTNHHCAVSDIQHHSTVTNNLLRDGFWASDYSAELPLPGKTALTLKRVEDLTDQILSMVDFNDPNYFERTTEIAKDIVSQVEQSEEDVFAQIVPMYNHNQFFLFVYNRYTDIRLVGAPPSSIGNFGGDIDNWTWPRHTGDFALYRIYTSPKGVPADYSKRNVPLKSKNHFKISLQGVADNDFAMVIGYPGTTYRYSSSYQAANERDVVAPWVDEVWGGFIASIKRGMQTDSVAKVKLTDKHDMLVNFWQKDTYQAQSLRKFNVVPKLQQREKEIAEWLIENGENSEFLLSISDYYNFIEKNRYEQIYRSLTSLTSWPVEVGSIIYDAYDFIVEVVAQKPSKRRVRREAKRLKNDLPNMFENYNEQVDKELFAKSLESLLKYLPDSVSHPLLNEIRANEDLNLFIPFLVDYFYDQSNFSSKEKLNKFLENPVADSLFSDPLFILHLALESQLSLVYDSLETHSQKLRWASRDFTKALLSFDTTQVRYPDANSTMRLSYGKITGYSPTDGVKYLPITYFEGKVEKGKRTEEEFDVSPRELQLREFDDFGDYADRNGKLPICFLTDNDITNGNSGSPVLNAYGHLVGIAFDGNYEAMACDFMFEPEMQRTIATDIRYVLFVIDKFAQARHLLNELTVVGELPTSIRR